MESRNGLALLEIDRTTLFALSPSGRIEYEREPGDKPPPGPRMWLAGCPDGNVACFRHDVRADTASRLETLTAGEPPLQTPESDPVHLTEYVNLLAREAPVETPLPGVVYRFPNDVRREPDADMDVVASGTPSGDALLAALSPREVADLWPPWCVVVRGRELACVAMTARLGPLGAELGVFTLSQWRRRGYARVASAAWAAHPALRERVLFYSTQRDNVPSRQLAERLRLPVVGASLRIP